MKQIQILIILLLLASCGFNPKNKKEKNAMINIEKGSYGYDKKFLTKYIDIVELSDGNAKVLLAPDYQGRVMTSSCKGEKGFSFGWINHDLIAEKQLKDQFNPFGGEERFWLGPEGGQFSLYFKKGEEFDFQNWQVPDVIDKEGFDLIDWEQSMARFQKQISLINYSGFQFDAEVSRTVKLLTNNEINQFLNVDVESLFVVAYESNNEIKNIGSEDWTKQNGLMSIWMLGMYNPSDAVTVVIPVKEGDEEDLGAKVNDDYFGKISEDRLCAIKNTVFFKADGKSRGKIGISPKRAKRFLGSYDAKNKALTILECILPQDRFDYVNSAWEMQENPYGGDAINSYNDGPLKDGTQMGPFYELESSSPALELKVQESYSHIQRTYHLQGEEQILENVSKKVLGVSIKEIQEAIK